jgi:hypothetical protein
MIRGILLVVLVMSPCPSLAAQIPLEQDDFPSVSLVLPANVPSETVQIAYFLVGPFGGYGGYTKQRPGLPSYQISALVEGKPASGIRVIVYASGCEIKTFVLPLREDSRVKQEFACQRAASVQLAGQIVPAELARRDNAELVVHYMAYWAHGFLGIGDGMVTQFELATVSPDANGAFQVNLPYFCATPLGSSSQQGAAFKLSLRDSRTGNYIAYNLDPEMSELRPKDHGLQILPHYPDGLKFTSGIL